MTVIVFSLLFLSPLIGALILKNTREPAGQITEIGRFHYPGSNVVKKDRENFVSLSSDTPSVIMNWYKEQIKSSLMLTISSSEVNSNGEILNYIIASNQSEKITVTVLKTAGNPYARIEVKAYD